MRGVRRRLLLTGGGDVLTSASTARPPHATFDAAEAGRDDYEIELVRPAIDADIPLLAICRGIQVLNVARGGTLVQDIPAEVPARGRSHGARAARRHRARGLDDAGSLL